VVKFQPSKLAMWVRFPSPAPSFSPYQTVICAVVKDFLRGREQKSDVDVEYTGDALILISDEDDQCDCAME
jgi:hypothetical protein